MHHNLLLLLQRFCFLGISLAVSSFWASSYLNSGLALVIFLISPKISSSKILTGFYFSGLAILFYRLLFENFFSPHLYSFEGNQFFIRCIVIYLSFSVLFLRIDILPPYKVFQYLAKFSWFALALNYIGFLLDILNIQFELIFPRLEQATGSFNGLSSGLNDNGVSIALFCCLRLLLRQKSAKTGDYIFLLLSLFALVILGSELSILLTVCTVVITQLSLRSFTKLSVVGLVLLPLFLSVTTLVTTYVRNYLPSMGILIGTEFNDFDLFRVLSRLTDNIRVQFLNLSLDLSTLTPVSLLFGYPKYMFNYYAEGNSHHSLLGEMISFGLPVATLYLVLCLAAFISTALSLIKHDRIPFAAGFVTILFVLSFSPSTSLTGFVYPLTFYTLGLFVSVYLELHAKIRPSY